MKPPSMGPKTGPTVAGMVSSAKARTSSDLGTVRSRTSRPTGTIMAAPMPWKKRAPTKAASDVDRAQRTEPIRNTTMEARKTVRAPSLSAIQPLIGMNTARLTR
jgi:hypothetical protein